MKKVRATFDQTLEIGLNQVITHATKILEERGQESRFCRVINVGGGEFEVGYGNVKFHIYPRTGNCACEMGQGSCIPCKHAPRLFSTKEFPQLILSLYTSKGKHTK